MRALFCRSLPLSLVGVALLAGCSQRTKEVAVAPPPPPVQPTVMPTPPLGATANMRVPAMGPDGRRITPNRDLSEQATLWHVRMALNVAALSCRDATDAARLQYNQFLKLHKAALAKANNQVDGEYKARFGGTAIPQREKLNTVVYNFFALPPAQAAFCSQAVNVGAAINAMPTGELLAYAPTGLAALEKPFTDFYDAYAVYQTRLAQWQGRGSAPQTLSQAGSAPGPVALKVDLSHADMAQDDSVIAPKGLLSRLFAKAD